MLIRTFVYPDSLLTTPFSAVPALRVKRREADMRAALARAEAAEAALVAARAGTYRLRDERAEAVRLAMAERLAARAALASLRRSQAAGRVSRSETVRALVVAAAYHTLPPAAPLSAAKRAGKPTSVAIPDVVDLIARRSQPDGNLAVLVDRALAVPDVVALATSILLLPAAEQDSFAYETFEAFRAPDPE